ncbi:MAG: hypothetical protein WAM42_01565, partial [Candidatus Nitrosopolaris sp.]
SYPELTTISDVEPPNRTLLNVRLHNSHFIELSLKLYTRQVLLQMTGMICLTPKHNLSKR